MSVLNPEHLFDQGERLLSDDRSGLVRQVDVRRAISNAYYGVFHFTATALADEFVGRSHRALGRYALVYRSLDHRALKAMCIDVQKTVLPQKLLAVAPETGFGPNIVEFATIVVDLQDKRHRADYDPASRLKASDAALALRAARRAVRRFGKALPVRRKTFLTLLPCPPRQG